MAEKKNGMIQRAWHSRGAAWSAAIVIAVVLLLTIGLIIWNTADAFKPKNDQPVAAPTPANTSPAPSTRPTSAQPQGCQVPMGDTSLRPAVPKDLRWEAANGGTWPVSDTYGPTKQKNGFGVCFARSPLGAALAAASFWSAQYSGHSGKDVIRQYAADSPGKTVLLRGSEGEDSSKIPATTYPMVGFTIDAFAPDEAIVTTVFSANNSPTGFAGIAATFHWIDGDWKLAVPVSGDYISDAPSTPVEGQFISWRSPNGM